MWSYTSAPPYVVTSRYLIKHTVNCTFSSALERAQFQIWDTERREQLIYCETPCDYHLSPVDNLSEGWRVSFGRGNTTTTLRSTVYTPVALNLSVRGAVQLCRQCGAVRTALLLPTRAGIKVPLSLTAKLWSIKSSNKTISVHVQHLSLLTYLLTPWSTVLLEKLTGAQLVNKLPAFYGTRRFITAFTSSRHLSLSWARLTQFIPHHPTFWRPILILSFHLRLGLPSGLFRSGFPTKTLYTPLPSPIRATCPAMIKYDTIRHDTTRHDMWYIICDIWYDIWYNMIWYDTLRNDTTRHDMWYMICDMILYDIWYDMIWYNMIRYDTTWHDTTRYVICDMWYDTIWCDMMWYMMYDIYDMICSFRGLTSVLYIFICGQHTSKPPSVFSSN